MSCIKTKREIAPTILTDVQEIAASQLSMILRLNPVIKRFHIDIITMDFLQRQKADGTPTLPLHQWIDILRQAGFPDSIPIDIHLMTTNPSEYIAECKKVNAQRVYGHIEYMEGKTQGYITFLHTVTSYDMKAGLALDLTTPIEEIADIANHPNLDAVLLLAVIAGRQGQTFHDEVLQKIAKLRRLGFQGSICIDGNMNKGTIPRCLAAGATYIGVGSALVRAQNQTEMQKNWEELQ